MKKTVLLCLVFCFVAFTGCSSIFGDYYEDEEQAYNYEQDTENASEIDGSNNSTVPSMSTIAGTWKFDHAYDSTGKGDNELVNGFYFSEITLNDDGSGTTTSYYDIVGESFMDIVWELYTEDDMVAVTITSTLNDGTTVDYLFYYYSDGDYMATEYIVDDDIYLYYERD